MSTGERVVDAARLSSFELTYGLDEPDEPTTVSVFALDVSPNWLTIDAAHAVPREDVAATATATGIGHAGSGDERPLDSR
jgi:hypothetical protein